MRHNLGEAARLQGDYQRATSLFRDNLLYYRAEGDQWEESSALAYLGLTARDQGDYNGAEPLVTECLRMQKATENKVDLGDFLNLLGDVKRRQGAFMQAEALFQESLALNHECGDTRGIADSHCCMGRLARDQGDLRRAAELGRQTLALWRKMGYKEGVARALEDLSAVASQADQPHRALLLAGAAEALRDAIKAPMPPCDRPGFAVALDAARGQVGMKESELVQARGRTISLDESIKYALGEADIQLREDPVSDPSATRRNEIRPGENSSTMRPADLTERELQVIKLVADGLTDREVAGRLFISPRTVGNHLRSIFGKLGLNSRSALAAWVVRTGMTNC